MQPSSLGKLVTPLVVICLGLFCELTYSQAPPTSKPETGSAGGAMQRALAMGRSCKSPYFSKEDGFVACFPQTPELKHLTFASGEGRVYSLAYDEKGCSYHYNLTTSPVTLDDVLLKKEQARQFYLESTVRELAQEAGVSPDGIKVTVFLFSGKYYAMEYELRDDKDPSTEPIVTKGLLIIRDHRLYEISVGTNCGNRQETRDRLDTFLGAFALQ